MADGGIDELLLAPNKAAILVVDLQFGYLSPNENLAQTAGLDLLGIGGFIEPLERLLEEARGYRIPVVWSRLSEDADFMPKSLARKMRAEIPQFLQASRHCYDRGC